MIDRTNTDFPEPDSPTIPMHSPDASSNETPSTACSKPRGVGNAADRASTRSSGL